MAQPTPAPLILIVDDARDIRDSLARYFQQSGFRTAVAADCAAARRELQAGTVDLMVLDVMMPGEDGLSLCREVRATRRTPTILLTALAEETDRVVGLEVGADDYVTKPFSPRELVARIKAVLRRAQAPEPTAGVFEGAVAFDGWTLHKGKRELRDPKGVLVPLSGAEFHLLAVFVSRPNAVLKRGQLLELGFGREEGLFDRSIDNQVSRLRRKLGDDPRTPRLIKTVRGGGYSFTATVTAL